MRHIVRMAVLLFLSDLIIQSAISQSINGAWAGSIKLPDSHLAFIVKIKSIENNDLNRIFFSNGDEGAVDVTLVNSDQLKFLLSSDNTEYVFDGNIERRQVNGWFYPKNNPESKFPLRMVSIGLLDKGELNKFVGAYQFDSGDQMIIKAVNPGFLRAFDLKKGKFYNLYLDTNKNNNFFNWEPQDIPTNPWFVHFKNDSIHHSRLGYGIKIRQDSTVLTIKRSNRDLIINLPETNIHFVRIMQGSFEKGDVISDKEALQLFGLENTPNMELPTKHTKVKEYWIDQSEITNAQFKAFADEEAYITEAELNGYGLVWIGEGFKKMPEISWRNPFASQSYSPDNPVVYVTWNDANAFCKWISQKTGLKISLPSEDEWEYASREGKDVIYGFGNNPSNLNQYGWFNGNTKSVKKIKTRLPNGFGIYDMHGNVWEWCSDWFVPKEKENDFTPSYKILKGGSWLNGPFDCRSAYRAYDDPDLAEPHIGFRVVLHEH